MLSLLLLPPTLLFFCRLLSSVAPHHTTLRPGQGEVGSMGAAVSVVKLQKSGGVVQRPPQARQQARTSRIKEYFFGANNSLQPTTVTMDVSEMKVFRIGGCTSAPSGDWCASLAATF